MDKAESQNAADGNILSDALEEAAKKVKSVLKEANRLHKNGITSIVDAADTAVHGLNGIKAAVSSTAKDIKDNPKQAYDNAKSKVNEAKGFIRESTKQATDNIVDTYNRRDEIREDIVEQVKFASENPDKVASSLKQHGKEFTTGIWDGVTDSAQNLYGHLDVGKEDLEELDRKLKKQAEEFTALKAVSSQISHSFKDTDGFFDALLVGGDVLHQALAQHIPPDVLMAFELQFPNVAEQESFREFILGKSTEEARRGVISAIKGKLFEIQYVDYLNNGHLEEGYSAVLAEKANQPGYDIEIHGPDGHISDLIQAKAVESIGNVKRALDRFPDIHIVSTTEVHSELVLRGYAESVSDGGITNSSLNSEMHDAASAADSHFHGPSVISLALLAFTSYTKEDLTAYERSHYLGERTSNYMLSYAAGGATHYGLASLGDPTGISFAAFIVSTLTRKAIGNGKEKVATKKAMESMVRGNEIILERLRGQNL